MAATMMAARYEGTCAATGRKITVGTMIFKSVIGWTIMDEAGKLAVRQAVATGQVSPVAPVSVNRAMPTARMMANPDWLSREMDREDSAF